MWAIQSVIDSACCSMATGVSEDGADAAASYTTDGHTARVSLVGLQVAGFPNLPSNSRATRPKMYTCRPLRR